ncbi:MAG: hypothetical protein KC657_28625 [Myxococcales bacterium]|nr:hypothetical protein [Myxococcales bacterium]
MGRSAAIFFSLIIAVGVSLVADCRKASRDATHSSSSAPSSAQVAPGRG